MFTEWMTTTISLPPPHTNYMREQMNKPLLEQKSRQIRVLELNSYKSHIKANRSSNKNQAENKM